MKTKDGTDYTESQVRALHPNVSFGPNTYAELGYSEYVPPAETLEEARTRVLGLAMAKENEGRDGATVSFLATTFKADRFSQSQIAAVLASYTTTLPGDFTWPDVNEAEVGMNLAQLRSLAQLVEVAQRTEGVNGRANRNALRVAPDLTTIYGIEATL